MKQQDIAKIYARSVLELADKTQVDVVNELTRFQEMVFQSNDLESLLFLGIFSSEEKTNVLKAIFEKVGFSEFVKNLIFFLVNEKRINLLPFIYKEVMVLDDDRKGFMRVNVEGPFDQINDEDRAAIENYLKKNLSKTPKLVYKKTDAISGGYRVKAGDLFLDATVKTQFEGLKQMIIGD